MVVVVDDLVVADDDVLRLLGQRAGVEVEPLGRRAVDDQAGRAAGPVTVAVLDATGELGDLVGPLLLQATSADHLTAEAVTELLAQLLERRDGHRCLAGPDAGRQQEHPAVDHHLDGAFLVRP